MKIALRRVVIGIAIVIGIVAAGTLFGITVGNMADNSLFGAAAGIIGAVVATMVLYIGASIHYNSNEHKHAHR